jgi:hypothetical protein
VRDLRLADALLVRGYDKPLCVLDICLLEQLTAMQGGKLLAVMMPNLLL